jgi:hypothetical protein
MPHTYRYKKNKELKKTVTDVVFNCRIFYADKIRLKTEPIRI